MARRTPPPSGFRFDAVDAIVLAAAVAASALLRLDLRGFQAWWIPGYVAGSFFLFCNVLRIGTRLEVPWAIASVAGIGGFAWAGVEPALAVLTVAEPVRLAVTWWSLRIGWYRGVKMVSLSRLVGVEPQPGPRPPFRSPF